MADINNFRQLDFQESGNVADGDRVLIIRLDAEGKPIEALNYSISQLKIYVTQESQSALSQINIIKSEVSSTADEVKTIRDTMEERIETIVGSAITSIVTIEGVQYAKTESMNAKGEPFTEYTKVTGA